MGDDEYLNKVLKGQDLADDSEELKELQQHRADVEKLLRKKFAESNPTIRYGGSKAKGTLIRESYDLDIACYFAHDDTKAGETLEDIYNNVKKGLEEEYEVEPKTSAIRLLSKKKETFRKDFHIDVVPGRFTDDTKTDCYLHQNGGDKQRLKTNLQVHIDHVKGSGVVPALRLLKLWKVRKAIRVKQFAFELLGIELLAKKKSAALSEQVKHVWTEIAAAENPITIKDPANPEGNDLMPLLRAVWQELRSVSKATLKTLDESGWEGVFGPVDESDKDERARRVASVAVAVTRPTRPYGGTEGE
jgi:hypothetical protein